MLLQAQYSCRQTARSDNYSWFGSHYCCRIYSNPLLVFMIQYLRNVINVPLISSSVLFQIYVVILKKNPHVHQIPVTFTLLNFVTLEGLAIQDILAVILFCPCLRDAYL
jgi:hypothetical protein